MRQALTIIDYPGTYGGPASRLEVLRALKEALALVESTPPETSLACAGLRIEQLAPARPTRGGT